MHTLNKSGGWSHWSALKGRRLLTLYVFYGVLAAIQTAPAMGGLSLVRAGVLLASGLVAWTLAEYFLHRGPLHAPRGERALRRLSANAHWEHHDSPLDDEKISSSILVTLPIYAAFFGLFLLLFRDLRNSLVFGSGFVLGYLLYETLHYYQHHRPSTSRIGRFYKRHHAIHHFKDPTRNFGVSVPIWDWIFRTYKG